MILSILAPALHCDWRIGNWKQVGEVFSLWTEKCLSLLTEKCSQFVNCEISQALLTTVVFLGMGLSSFFWGSLSDAFGRKKALLLSCILLCHYGWFSEKFIAYTQLQAFCRHYHRHFPGFCSYALASDSVSDAFLRWFFSLPYQMLMGFFRQLLYTRSSCQPLIARNTLQCYRFDENG